MKIKIIIIGLLVWCQFGQSQNPNKNDLTVYLGDSDTSYLSSFAFSYSHTGLSEEIQALKSTANSNTISDSTRMAALLNVAKFYIDINNDTSEIYARESKKLAQKLKLSYFEAQTNDFLGAVCVRLGKIVEGYDLLLKAEKSFLELRDSTFLIVVYRNLGNFFKNQNEFQIAKKYYYQGIAIKTHTIPDSIFRSWALMDLGDLYLLENNIDSAYLLSKQAYDIWYNEKSIIYSKKYVPIIQNNLGKILARKGDIQGALAQFYKGAQVGKEFFNTQSVGDIYISLTELYKKIGQADSAFVYAKKAYTIGRYVNNPTLIEKASMHLVDIYRSRNRIDSAFYYQNILLSAINFNRNADKTKQIQNISFQKLLNDQDLKTKQQNFNTKIKFYSLSAIMGILLIAGYFLFRSNKQKLKANQVLEHTLTDLKTSQTQLEIKNRDLEIESSLERVRSKTMAMQKSNEVLEIANTLYDELQNLDFKYGACTIMIMDKKTSDIEHWVAGFSHRKYPESYSVAYFNNPCFEAQLSAWKNGEAYKVYELAGDIKKSYDEVMFTQTGYKNFPEEEKKWMQEVPSVIFSWAFMKHGALQWGPSHLSNEQANILQRFASVFEQSYTRFLDLQKAEEQARESQIEVALERVRSRTMAMQKSEHLVEVINVVAEQLLQLNFRLDTASFFLNDETDEFTFWLAAIGETNPNKIVIPKLQNPALTNIKEALKQGVNFFTDTLTFEEKNAWFQHVFDHSFGRVPEDRRKYILNTEGYARSVVLMKQIGLFIVNYVPQPYTDAENTIFKRFAFAFEQAYIRFLDLQKAESQAREAQIEVALERVRSKTLAMQSSNELSTIIGLLYSEMGKLDVQLQRCFFMIFNPQNLGVTWWMASGESLDLGQGYFVPYSEHPPQLAYLKGWQERLETWRYLMQGEEKANWDAFLFHETELVSLPSFIIDNMKSFKSIHLEGSFNSFGCLTTGNEQPLNDEAFDLLIRFSKVFDLTYTRFNDITIAEAQAEQARLDLIQIQTEKKRAEDALSELRITQNQLIQKEKLASLGELTAGIAHEIQNPLNFVNNFSELSVDLVKDLKDELKKPEKDETYIDELFDDLSQNQEKINHHGKRASSIVKGMLEHSRASTGVKELTDINKLADEYLRLSYHGLRAKDKDFNADFKTDFEGNLPKIEVIPQDIGRVLLNLINNAFYAVHQRELQPSEGFKPSEGYTPSVLVSTKWLDNQIIIKVKDNGIGMSEATKVKIFQPFFTTKPTGQGTGLGLSLAYDIVTKGHGGTLEVESTEGVGTEFTVHLLFEKI